MLSFLTNVTTSMVERGVKEATVMSILSTAAAMTVVWGVLKLLKKFLFWRYSPLRNVAPGPKSSFLMGEFLEIRREAFMQPHLRWIQEITGWDVPLIHYSAMFGRSTVLVLDKEIVKQILRAPYGKNPLRFGKDVQFLKNVLGEGLVTLEGEDWMRHRQIIQPAFFMQVLKASLNECVPPLTRRLVQSWKKAEGREIDLSSHLSSLTLDIIGQVAFSHQFNALDGVERWATGQSGETLPEADDPLIQALLRSFQPSVIGMIAFMFSAPSVNLYFNPRTRGTRKALNAAVDEVIAQAKQKMKDDGPASTKPRSLLQLMLQAAEGESKRPLSDVDLRDETKTFLFAGHETTSTWCNMAIYALVTYPDIQDRVYQDVMRHASNTGPLDLETVDKMEYVSAFLQEVLRLHPPIGMFARVSKFTENFAGYTVPAGTRLVMSSYLLHRHPKYWKDPEAFQPERWLQKDEENDEFLSQIRFAFVPFSAGGRNCIGQRFATVEAKLIMAELVRSFIFQIAPSQQDTKFAFSNIIVMRIKPNLKIVVKSRE